jgi:DNA-binding response OmpR family regulator
MPSSPPTPFLLLVEDSEDDAFFFRDALRRAKLQHELVHVMDGQAAIDYLSSAIKGQARRPDLVFLDLKLPGLNGFDVLTWLSAQSPDPAITVCVLSGSEHPSDTARATALGAAGYYVKPITGAHLRERFEAFPQTERSAANLSAASVAPPRA